MLKDLLNFLFPKKARVLELESISTEKLSLLLPQAAPITDDSLTALFDYNHPLVKEIVWEIKYAGNKVLADKASLFLYDALFSELLEQNIFEKFPSIILMPIPVSDKRRYERGWNQAELLTEAMKKRDTNAKFKYLPRQLAKVVHTESQTKTADKRERGENLKNSMRVLNSEKVRGSCVAVVDDVLTTGSTFKEAKRALREAGAKRVICLAFAH